jgi:peptidoglycan/LPS O-acetylase OafA/YrhL
MRGTEDGNAAAVWARLDGRDNALNAIRLLLAVTVLFGHSYSLGYGIDSPLPQIEARAVEGFFAISGYLIARGRTRTLLWQFLWHRVRRVYPGMWGSLVMTAFLIAPMAGWIAGQPYSWSEAASYV